MLEFRDEEAVKNADTEEKLAQINRLKKELVSA